MTDNNSKLRAVLLAALMVLWVFAGTMAFAGGAAADLSADGITIDNVDVSPNTGSDTATYTINTSFNDTTGGDVNSGSVDFSDAGSDGIDVSQASITVYNQSGVEVPVTNTNVNGDTFEFNIETQNTSDTDGLDIVFEDVQNPVSGTYDLTTTLHSSNNLSGDSGTDTASYTIQASATEAGADSNWDSGTTKWQGQELFFDQGDLTDHDNWQLRAWDGQAVDDRVGTLISDISFQGTSTVIDTSQLEGNYVITANDPTGQNREVIVSNGTGYATDSIPEADDNSTGEFVEIVVQNLDASFEDADGDEVDDVELDESRTLVLDSNRNGFAVEVSSENLTQDQLEKVFDDSTYSVSPTTDDDDNVTISGLRSESEIEATFNESNDIEEGDSLDFKFEATDTTAEADASITVGEATDGDADWDQAQFSENRGDVVTVSLTSEELDRFNVSLGSDDANYQAHLEVEPNDDDEVELEINTYLASRVALDDATVSEGDIYDTTDDGGEILNRSETTSNVNGRALDAGLYDLIIEDSNITTAEEDIQEYDVSVLSLEERSTGDMTIHTAPSNEYSSITDTEDVLEQIEEGTITESNTIALNTDRDSSVRGDAVIHRIDVSGIGGLLAYDGMSDYDQIANNNNLNLTLEQQNPGQNEDAFVGNLSDLGSSSTNVIADTDNDTLYIVLNSNELEDQNLEEGDELEASFNVTAEYQNNFLRERNQLDEDDPDDDESAMDSFELVDREATFDTVSDEVRVQPADNQVISGETTVAPGTEMTVRARATAEDTDGENAFLKSASAVVNADGTFEAEFTEGDSFEDVTAPQNFTATIQRQSFEDNAETDGRVVEGDYAEVSITNQTTDGTTATVDSVYLPDGGFVTIHDGTLLDGATFDSVRGTSEYLESGESTDVEVTLDTPYEADGTVIAMPHMDSNDNEAYDFVSSEGSDDGPYTNADGEAVTDSASLTVDTSTPTATATATATPEPSTPTAEPTDEPTETESEDQPGFGAVIALIALLGAALLAARRNAF